MNELFMVNYYGLSNGDKHRTYVNDTDNAEISS